MGEITPSAEGRDGLDNNCNGTVDEGFTVGATCTVGIGACHRSGTFVCMANGSGTECSATPGTPSDEICGNNVDENCDGQAPACLLTLRDPKVEIKDNTFEVKTTFSLGVGSKGVNPAIEEVVLEFNPRFVIPAGSFKFHPAKTNKKGKQEKPAKWTFEGVIGGVKLEVKITDLGGGSFEFKTEGEGANLSGITNPVTLRLTIGDDSGSTTVTAKLEGDDEGEGDD